MLVLAILKLPSEEESFPPEHLCEIENPSCLRLLWD